MFLSFIETLRLHRNKFYGKVPELVCSQLTKLKTFYADCENNLFDSDINYADGIPEVECECCTDCCSPGPQGECMKRDTVIPTPSPSKTSDMLLKDFIQSEFGPSNFDDSQSAYTKALTWLVEHDIYTSQVTDNLITIVSTNQNQASISELYGHFTQEITLRFFCALFYYEMSGDQWFNCSAAPFHSSLALDETNTCAYLNRDSELIYGKKRWLSPDHVCMWSGLTCDATNRFAIHIELSEFFFQ